MIAFAAVVVSALVLLTVLRARLLIVRDNRERFRRRYSHFGWSAWERLRHTGTENLFAHVAHRHESVPPHYLQKIPEAAWSEIGK